MDRLENSVCRSFNIANTEFTTGREFVKLTAIIRLNHNGVDIIDSLYNGTVLYNESYITVRAAARSDYLINHLKKYIPDNYNKPGMWVIYHCDIITVVWK